MGTCINSSLRRDHHAWLKGSDNFLVKDLELPVIASTVYLKPALTHSWALCNFTWLSIKSSTNSNPVHYFLAFPWTPKVSINIGMYIRALSLIAANRAKCGQNNFNIITYMVSKPLSKTLQLLPVGQNQPNIHNQPISDINPRTVFYCS